MRSIRYFLLSLMLCVSSAAHSATQAVPAPLASYTQIAGPGGTQQWVTVNKPSSYCFSTTQPSASTVCHHIDINQSIPLASMGSGVYLWGKPDSNATTFYVTAAADAVLGGGGGGSSGGDASAANQVTGNNTLASILAKQPALGTAGTASTNVITVQGIASGTNLNVNCATGCSGIADIVATGNISAANANAFNPGGSPTANSTVTTAALNGAASVSVNATGTFNQTLIIQASYDGANYDAVADVYNPDGTNGGHDGGNLLTGAPSGLNYTANVQGAKFVRVTCISYTSGTAAIVMRVSGSTVSGIDFLNFRTNQIYSNTGDIDAQITSAAGSLVSIDNKTPALVGGRQPVDGSGVTQPVSATSLPLPTGASTAAKQPALGTAGTASSDVISVQGVASMTALKTDGSAVTQPISAASLPLPTGAATSAAQTTAGTSLTTIATNTTNAATTTKQSDGSQKTQIVDGSGNVIAATSNALNVNLSSGGFATALNQTTANTSLSTIATNTGNGATSANQTNGTQLARITNGTQTADTVAGDSSQNALLAGVGRKTVTLTAATTAQTIDMLGYSSFSVIVSAISGTWSVQQSNDNTTFVGKFVDPTSNPAAQLGTSLTTTTGYESAITSRYLRITGGTSITASIVLSTAVIPPKVVGVNGTVSATQSGTWTTQPGNTANTTPWLQTMIPVVSPLSSSSPLEASVSTAYEASHIVKASAGVLYSLLCYNSKASDQFVETFNSTTLPADATVSVTVPMLCRAGSNCTLDFNPFGKYYSTGIVWSNSSTSPTKTIGSADMFCEPRYQ